MKKFLLSVYILSIVTFVGYSQSLSLSHDGTPVANGGEVVFTGEPTSSLIEAHMDVTSSASDSIDVLCKKEEITLVSGSMNTFCWDNCYPPNIYVSLGPIRMGQGQTVSAFIGEYQPMGNAGQSIIRYTYFDQNNPNVLMELGFARGRGRHTLPIAAFGEETASNIHRDDVKRYDSRNLGRARDILASAIERWVAA